MSTFISSNLGYPRIGANREWKKVIESYWQGNLEEQELLTSLQSMEIESWKSQLDRGISILPVGDFTKYDHVLDVSVMFGLVPARFPYEGGQVSLSTYYGIARGTEKAAASEMTKWFNTNYHYIVPELDGSREPKLTVNRPLEAYRRLKQELGVEGKPVLLGLYTFLKLAKITEGTLQTWVEKLLPCYVEALRELKGEGATWIQLDEPALVTSVNDGEMILIKRIYEVLSREVPGLNLIVQTYFESVDRYEELIKLPIQGIGLDFVHGRKGNIASLRQSGFPTDKTLFAGVVDGRNIWRTDLKDALELLHEISRHVGSEVSIAVQPSCSLLHVPVSAKAETSLPDELAAALAFAEEKLEEIRAIVEAAKSGQKPELFERTELVLQTLAEAPSRRRTDVHEAVHRIKLQPANRTSGFSVRKQRQQERLKLPLLPTTTIGSFPQSKEVRAARLKWRKAEWSEQQYREFIDAEIRKWMTIQEEIGLDMLVHGEFERTDMVEFFGEKLPGFAFTRGGWVQSYGTRCVKPPVIHGDVAFDQPMTVRETVYAQSLTSRPVKGMLTGPVTILNWSFVRSDLPRQEVAYQIALALREEVEALEAAGIAAIQVDEPAIREGFPLKPVDRQAYLDWAVQAFKITTSSVQDDTQIHTHMCYCDFHDMLEAIEALDADVISIETSRSHGELIHSFEQYTYPLGIGLGVYDIHSPRVPSEAEMGSMIERALQVLDPGLFWINPDCGLKTRGEKETVAALKNMVSAARHYRSYITEKASGVR